MLTRFWGQSSADLIVELGLIYWVANKDSEYISANQLRYRYYYLQYRGGPYISPPKLVRKNFHKRVASIFLIYLIKRVEAFLHLEIILTEVLKINLFLSINNSFLQSVWTDFTVYKSVIAITINTDIASILGAPWRNRCFTNKTLALSTIYITCYNEAYSLFTYSYIVFVNEITNRYQVACFTQTLKKVSVF